MWHEEMVFVAEKARFSSDPSSKNAACLFQNGALLTATVMTNRIPSGVRTYPNRWQRPIKYKYVEHAERGCIYEAAKYGIATKGCTLVALWAACSDCARAIICAGIAKVVTLAPTAESDHPGWTEDIALAMGMLEEAKVPVVYVEGPLGVTVKRNGIEVAL